MKIDADHDEPFVADPGLPFLQVRFTFMYVPIST